MTEGPAPRYTKDRRLTIVLPAYDEGGHLYRNLRRVAEALTDRQFEIVVVDDGSADATFDEARRARAAGLPVRAARLEQNRGKGAALAHGAALADGDLVAFLDSDLEIPPEYIVKLADIMDETCADVVIGVRDEPRGSDFPLPRRALSRAYRELVSWLFGLEVKETQAGIKLFSREVLDDCLPRLTAERFAFDVELLAASKRFGYRIAECPVRAEYCRHGSFGRLGIAQMIGMLAETLAVYYRASFWCWLGPGTLTKLWMLALALGIFLFGMGVAKLLTPLVLHGPIKHAFSVLALQFLPRVARDWLLALAGLGLAVAALVHLNRSLMEAFARVDRGDLAGILRVRSAGVPSPAAQTSESPPEEEP